MLSTSACVSLLVAVVSLPTVTCSAAVLRRGTVEDLGVDDSGWFLLSDDYGVLAFGDQEDFNAESLSDVVSTLQSPSQTSDVLEDFISAVLAAPVSRDPLPTLDISNLVISDRLITAASTAPTIKSAQTLLVRGVEVAQQALADTHARLPSQARTVRKQISDVQALLPEPDPSHFRAWANAFKRAQAKAISELSSVENTANQKVRGLGVVKVDSTLLSEVRQVASLLNKAFNVLRKIDPHKS